MKPYTILHILSNLNGKISGSFFGDPACFPALKAYSELRQKLNCQAVVYGKTTMEEGYSDGLYFYSGIPNLIKDEFEDYIADDTIGNYIVSLDPQGTLAFKTGFQEKKGRAKAHVIQVLTGNAVGEKYLDDLKKAGVSYLYGGKNQIDVLAVLEKLNRYWKIERIMIAGGGITDWNFAKDNLLDELSLVVAPIVSSSSTDPSVFEGDADNINRNYEYFEAQKLSGNALWLRYKKEK